MSKPMSMRFAAKYYAPDATAWTNYADWQAAKLFPLTEKLMAHKDQPYSGNMLLSMKQAASRLQISDADRQYAEMAEAEINSTIIRMGAGRIEQ